MKRLPVPLVGAALALLLAASLFFGVALGETKLDGAHLVRALLAGPANGDPILWLIRLPRALLAALVGAALASAGTSLQGLTGNILLSSIASPCGLFAGKLPFGLPPWRFCW